MKKTNALDTSVPPYDGFEDEVMNAGWLLPIEEGNVQNSKPCHNTTSKLSENDSDSFLARVYVNQE
jgi:hypothetical protein